MEKQNIKILVTPPVKSGEQIKIFDHMDLLIHEGLTTNAPNSPYPWRDDGNGIWTYFFQNLNGGITVASPHKVTFLDGSGYFMKANPFLELWNK